MSIRALEMRRWGWLRRLYRKVLAVRQRAWMRGAGQARAYKVGGLSITVLPGVFDGIGLRTGLFLAQAVDSAPIPEGARVLDLGTGSGIGALWAARQAATVIATDINPEAVGCARLNAVANGLQTRIETRAGDLFEPVRGERFDLILFNPPFYRGQPRDMADYAWRNPDAFQRFLRELPLHLTDHGWALIVLSSDGDIAGVLEAATHLSVRLARRRDFINEVLSVYELRA